MSVKHFKKYFLFFCCSYVFVLCKPCKAAVKSDRLRVGLKNDIELVTDRNDHGVSVFMNYSINPKMSFELDFKSMFPDDSNVKDTEELNVFKELRQKDWSTRVTFNMFLRDQKQCFMPYVGLGVGNYYSYNSKVNIKRVRADKNDDSIDFDLRKLLRRPGVFATFGLQYCATERMIFYLQAKSTVMFEKAKSLSVRTESGFSDLFNISTGFRFSIN